MVGGELVYRTGGNTLAIYGGYMEVFVMRAQPEATYLGVQLLFTMVIEMVIETG